ncbi:HDIG domain-containing protein [Salinimicrobium sp. MT39]|uniref:HDIG domain-containing protein n=1 Tax=Salinimicrobium profundisediminis TaxID=2994553 RepID=A0A9X3CV00_9FLAO|nr:HDIG domain-containing metalloprotein [Salinimicrobium profundisediminis]MCX2837347.1 HDIG domain-containing protein [Salinimicrobium profundisediminis]
MKSFINSLYKNQDLFYKVFLFLLTTFIIVYMFPKGGKFKYEIPKGKPWQYENLYAPFDFAILKAPDELAAEKEEINKTHVPYYDYNAEVVSQVEASLDEQFVRIFPDTLTRRENMRLQDFIQNTFEEIYDAGVLQEIVPLSPDQLVYLREGNEVTEVTYKSIIKQNQLRDFLNRKIDKAQLQNYREELIGLFFDSVKSNVTYNEALTQSDLESRYNQISYTRGNVERGTIIVAKGEVVEGDKLQVLNSLKAEYESQVWSEANYNWVIVGYTLLVFLALLMLMLFIRKYRYDIFQNNIKVTFIFFNVTLMVLLTVLVIRFNVAYVYVVPLCVLPLTIKGFFDSRLGLFTHVITVLLLGFIVPDSYEYMFLQIIAGIVTILTVSELYKRANLFITVGQITLVYIVSYFAFTIIQEGSIYEVEPETFLMFLLGGLATLFVQPLIYAYEKIFGLISDMSLLELSDTNSKLLKELSDKAPGTFHHSLNVANLAEAAANEINANAMLVRVGALYHDIGKMRNPTYFTENQTTSVNSHDELSPKESAEIIIEHVINGIEVAKKRNLPDRVIDFIRTHHGTTTVYYFLKKAMENDQHVNEDDYRYPGPMPFSKETAILMMCDSVEAASRSIKEPTANMIDEFVERIINKQMEDGQFLNSNITFMEIQQVKKVLKRKLKNIYHLRIEYPE